jgi:hypothetical protein
MKKLVTLIALLSSLNAFAEFSIKGFAEPYMEKSLSSKAQKTGNIASELGSASTFSLGSRVGIESYNVIGGLGFDYTSSTVANDITTRLGYELSYQSLDLFVGYKFLDIFKVTYSRALSGRGSANDGTNREVKFSSNRIAFGVLLNKKAYVELSRSERDAEQVNNALTGYHNRAEVYDTYSLGLSFPIELY